jgi:ketosteroid isomerase-like protein
MTQDEVAVELAALRARLRTLEDIEAIKRLHATFTRTLADREFLALPGFFTADAVIDMRRHGEIEGSAAITAHYDGMVSVPLAGAGYVLSSPVIAVVADEATGEWTWHRFLADGSWQEGRYRCSYRRTENGWLFSRMHFRVVLPIHDDTATDRSADE